VLSLRYDRPGGRRAARRVVRLERTETVLADGNRGRVVSRTAQGTREREDGESGGLRQRSFESSGHVVFLSARITRSDWTGRKENARCQKDTRDARPFSSCLTWLQYAANHHEEQLCRYYREIAG
jgi:hypothetical protein